MNKSFSSPTASKAGAALIIVLAFLVLITVMVVAFFSSVTSEASSVQVQADALAARQLADSTTQYVISQIRGATSGGTTKTWASQPGMIRTYASDGSPAEAYKLYSANEMVSPITGTYDPSTDLPGGTWTADESVWTDLNHPVTGAGGAVSFPILDPRAAAAPAGKVTPMVDGFSFDASKLTGAKAPATTEDATARAPMPVRWLYMLEDGRWTNPSGGTGGRADFSGSAIKPTVGNPIVARVAFWTDDETAKLNLNTAAGGNHWEIPTYTAGIDLNFSRYKPIKNEFARYPGHPATTSLLPVFWSFAGLPSPNYNLFPDLNPPLPYRYSSTDDTAAGIASADVTPKLSELAETFFRKTLSLVPRNMWGGSEMGSKSTVLNVNQQVSANTTDSDRLYASMDEALYAMPAADDAERPMNAFAFRDSDISKLGFFLTTQSRAPDINPFNQPRVGMWPVPENEETGRTPTDRLIAFCSTLNQNAYYFTRGNPDSPTADFLPGSRNDEIFDYLARSLGQSAPGFGGSVGERYGADRTSGILALVYDYIRGSVNLTDTFDAKFIARFNMTAPYAFVPPRVANNERGKGQVIPIRISKDGETHKGLGRFVTVKQAALQFIAVAANQPPAMIDLATGIPTTVPNPMHPWVADPPAAISVTDNGDGTWAMAATNSYPTIDGQTHAGLPMLTNKWIQTPTAFANPELRVSAINPRYQGPVAIYGSGGGGGATNSALLPEPAPIATPEKLGPHQTLIQAVFLVDPVVVNPGTPPYKGKYQVRVQGLESFTAGGNSLGFPADIIQVPADHSLETTDYGADYITISTHDRSSLPYNSATNTGYRTTTRKLSFVGTPVIVGPGETFNFGGGTVTIEIRTEPANGDPTLPSNLGELIQTVRVEFPSASQTATAPFPTPLLPPMPVQGTINHSRSQGIGFLQSDKPLSQAYVNSGTPAEIQDLAPAILLTFDASSPLGGNPNFGVGASVYKPGSSRSFYPGSSSTFAQNFILPARMTDPAADPQAKMLADTVRSVEVLYGDTRVSGGQAVAGTEFFKPHRDYHDAAMRGAHTLRVGLSGQAGTNARGSTDHLLSNAAKLNPASGFTYTSDHRPGVEEENFRGVPASAINKIRALGAQHPRVVSAIAIRSDFPHVTSSVDFDVASFQQVWNLGGDYDTGPGLTLDGPFIGKTNEGGEMQRHLTHSSYEGRNTNPDFNIETFEFSLENLNNAPNRQVPSPVILGSLPVGNSPDESWRTLVFSPNPNSPNHASIAEVAPAGEPPIKGKAPDYLLLDFFHMPVVEPYAISEPFSTAGRVNMNYQIAPFTYIRRDTALRGVLRSGMVTAVEDERVQNRKMRGFQSNTRGRYDDDPAGGDYTKFLQQSGHWAFRYPIHLEETLKQFQDRFNNGDIFRAPSEICSLWLYPGKQPTASNPENPSTSLVAWDENSVNIKKWWYDNPGTSRKSVTSDNLRERPYATLYPRLTTKSNTFTTYFKVQVLKKARGAEAAEWVEDRDQVRSEYRGSATVERYIDPSDPSLPDFSQAAHADASLDDFYRYRVSNTKRFAP